MKSIRRPALKNAQIKKFKKDVKLIARHVSAEAELIKSLPITFSQNQFAQAIGFDSFSELRLNENKYEHAFHDFDLMRDVDAKTVYEAFKEKKITLQQAHDGLESARESLKPVMMQTISFKRLIAIINETMVSEHQYTITDSKPREFKVMQTDAFFKHLEYGDVFILEMPDGEQFYYTVVESFAHIYEPEKWVFTIRAGFWVAVDNGGFCTGHSVKGVG